MSLEPDEGPVYYREIQKNAYLKRVPNDVNTSKLRALGQKKPQLKAMWTLFCVHNGTTPFLEQYPAAECGSTLAHRPTWRACLSTARHVTASVQPRAGDQYDFLIDTEAGPVRMRAPDWDSMQEWVTTLRDKLYELRIVSRGQNVYAAPPAAPPPRAAARDPTSPLPPTPPHPPQRVPGIELHTPIIRPTPATESQPVHNETSPHSSNVSSVENNVITQSVPSVSDLDSSNSIQEVNTNQNSSDSNNTIHPNSIVSTQNLPTSSSAISSSPSTSNSVKLAQKIASTSQNSVNLTQNSITSQNSMHFSQNSINSGPNSINLPVSENIDISSWDPSFSSLPSTSQDKPNPKKSVAKICGQNVCLDDSILKRPTTDSDEEFFAEIDRIHDSVENLSVNGDFGKYKQRVMVTDDERVGLRRTESVESKPQRTNITVIQVSNKPPHTAIPVLGPETDVFDFNFKQQLKITEPNQQDFVNIVNTESHVNTNSYGTVFSPDSDYGHLSLTTTVNVKSTDLTAVTVTDATVRMADGVYERLCMASTSNNERASPLSVRRIKMAEKTRKSSLPNLELTDESTYEYLFPNNNTTIPVNGSRSNSNSRESSRNNEVNSNVNALSRSNSQHRSNPRAVDSNAREIRSNVERSHSQNAYDGAPRREVRRVQNDSPKRDAKNDKTEAVQPKPIWKRGLTELSLLSKLRGIGLPRRQESPVRHEDGNERVTSPVKVIRRSRPEVRVDSARRRSNSLSNGNNGGASPPALVPLRARQAAALRAELRRGACAPGGASVADPPLLVEHERALCPFWSSVVEYALDVFGYDKSPVLGCAINGLKPNNVAYLFWVARWGRSGVRCGGRQGDRVVALAGTQITTVQQARLIFKAARTPLVDILFHRVPLGKIYVVNRRENESLGIKFDSECTITSVEGNSPAARVGIPPPGKWCVTEVNNRSINLVKGGEEEINRLCMHGTEVSILIQPASLVKKIRSAIKSSKSLLSIR